MSAETDTPKNAPNPESKSSDAPQVPPATELRVKLEQEKKSPWHQRIDTASKFVQIVALAIAAVWGLMSFKMTVVPSLEPKLGIDSELHWAAVPETSSYQDQKKIKNPEQRKDRICEAQFVVKVMNPGKGPFDVSSVTVKAWLVPVDASGLYPDDAMHPKAFDPTQLPDDKAFYNEEKPAIANDIVDHYSEGAQNSGQLHFFLKATPRAMAVFLARVEGTRPASYWPISFSKVPAGNYTYQIDQVCGANWDKNKEGN